MIDTTVEPISHFMCGPLIKEMGYGRLVKNYALATVLFMGSIFAWAEGIDQRLDAMRAEYATTFSEGRYAKSLVIAERILATLKKSGDTESSEIASSMLDVASAYNGLALADKALPFQQRAVEIYTRVSGASHPNTALALNKLALTYRDQAQPQVAFQLQIRALEFIENALGPDSIETGRVVNSLSVTYRDLALYEEALLLQLRAVRIYESILGQDNKETAAALSNLAQIYRAMAQYDKALPLQEQALATTEKNLGPVHPQTARMVNNLASTFQALGQYDKALQLFQRAVAINESTLGPRHRYTAAALHNLATVYKALSRYDQALPLFQRALVINEKSIGADHRYVATVLNEIGEIYGNLKQFEQALQLHQRALRITEVLFGPTHPDTAASLTGLALTNQALKNHELAIHWFHRALTINERVFGSNHPITLRNLQRLARSYEEVGHTELAISLLKQSVNGYQLQRERISRIGREELVSYTSLISPIYQHLVALLIDNARLSEAQVVLDMLKEDEQYDYIQRSSSNDPRKTLIGRNASEQLWSNRYRQVADRLAALGVEEQALQNQSKRGLSPDQKQRKQVLAGDLQVAQKAFDVFLHEMRVSFALSGPARATDIADLNVEAVSELQTLIKGLGHDAVLLQYYVTNDQVGMLLTTPGVQLARSVKVNAKELHRQIAEFRRLLRDSKSNLLPASQALYQLLVAPVAKDLEQAGAKTVMLSLDGALRYLPFGALHDGQRYLVQRWNLPMYTSVTKNRLRDAVTPQWQAAGLGVTRAIGEFAALPAVKTEMNSIVKAAGGGVLPGEVHLDEAFTAVRFKDVSQRSFQLLHVASHFRFSPGTEVNSFLLLGDGQQLTLGDIRTQNYRFDNVDLLTLSACDTGLGGGRDAQGREIEGFGVIAQQQGAKAVLATLWPVADQSTATLMAEMYRGRQEQKLTKTEALRQAQISLLSQSLYAHPFYWAPFILMGNWK